LGIGFTGSVFVIEVKKEKTVVKDLDNITTGTTLLVIARSILEDVASAECLSISTCFDQV
jgi:UDP-glucose 4-epimerase